MDIGEFIDQDILIFLDDRLDTKPEGPSRADWAESTVFIIRDYEKDIIAALEQANIPAAKQVLHDLKEQLDTCPPGPDREHLKALLLSLYERFKDYLDARHLAIDDPTLGLRNAPGVAKNETTMQQATAGHEDALGQVKALEAEVERALTEGRIGDAMRQYHSAKEAVNTLPSVPQEVALQLISLFGRVKQAAVEHRITAIHADGIPGPTQARAPAAKETESKAVAPTDGATTMDHALILQLEEEKRAMDKSLHAGDIGAAMQQYQRMKLIVPQITNTALAHASQEKLRRIYEIISSMKQHSAHNEQQLAKVTP